MFSLLRYALLWWVAAVWTPVVSIAAPDGQLELQTLDSATRQPLPVRVELKNARNRPVRIKKVGAGALGTHFYLLGQSTLGLQRGDYHFDLDAGPEYRTQRGSFTIQRHADDAKVVEMRRFATLADEGWYAGDLDALRQSRDLPLVANVEELHLAACTAWTYDGKRWKHSHSSMTKPIDLDDPYLGNRKLGPLVARVEMSGGALLLVADEPIEQPPLDMEPGWSSLQVVREARNAGLHVVAAAPTAWELPVWIALGELDAVQLLTRYDDGQYRTGADTSLRPRDTTFYPGKQGLSKWGMAVYFHFLNCGLQVTPLAGSGSGFNDHPLGTNRTYVYHTNAFSPEAWWGGVKRGATVVTNGPLLRPAVSGGPPGTQFFLDEGEEVEFQIALNLASRDARVEYLEIIKNGEIEAEVRLADWAAQGGRLPPVPFDDSGWFAVRAATDQTDKYQYALTAPYYVTSPAGPRISRQSVEFFLSWLDEIATLDTKLRSSTDQELASAKEFWQSLFEQANAP